MSWKIGGKFYRRTDVKMTLWYILTFLISALLICTFLYLRLRHQLIKEVDRFILDETKELVAMFSNNLNEVGLVKSFENKVKARTHYPVYLRILNKEGRPLSVSENLRKIGFFTNEKVVVNVENGKETREYIRFSGRRRPFRFISTPLSIEGRLTYIIQLGTHLKFVRKNLSNFRSNLLTALPIILVLGSLGGWVLARRSLSPIGYIASKARSITSENLSERLKVRGTDDEMDDLIRTINGMIARLESSFKRMAEFTADASHELKTPICAMRGEAEVLLSKERKVEEYQEGLAHFMEQFDHLNHMINDLILLSKFDTSQVELKMAPLRVDFLIKDLCNLFQILAEQKNIGLEMGTTEEVTMMGDKVRLQQLFTNLIDNAIKYTSKGSVHVTVKKNENAAIVKISDTGIGISKEEQKDIFKRFYRVDKSRSKETGGVGLGLSIVEWIAHAHKGRIEVYSKLNEGATFTVYVPILKA
jgi:heavy metal sensor kinase